jgi:hypothetical protein
MISREEKIEEYYYAALEYAVNQGYQKGVEQGIEQGIKQGIEQGIKLGRQKKRMEAVKKLLAANIPMETICMVTRLTSKQIEDLK